jgi:hypothetical protein
MGINLTASTATSVKTLWFFAFTGVLFSFMPYATGSGKEGN